MFVGQHPYLVCISLSQCLSRESGLLPPLSKHIQSLYVDLSTLPVNLDSYVLTGLTLLEKCGMETIPM